MKVHGDYSNLIGRILESGKEKADPAARPAERPESDRRELSRVALLLQQELARAQADHNAERAERLQRLATEIARGEYRVDDQALAAAMLEI